MEAFFIDTETADITGGVCDIAIAVVNDNLEIVRTYESLIDPERPISPGASGIHHITDEMVWASPTMTEFMEMNDWPIRKEHAIFAAHNVQFDCRVMGEFMPDQYKKLCTLRLARNMYPENENHKLQTLRYQFKLDAGTAHRAMGDVLTCLNFARMVAEQRGLDLAGVLSLSQVPLTLESRITFGKHKGEKLKDIPLGWVDWLLKQPTVDEDLRVALAPRLSRS